MRRWPTRRGRAGGAVDDLAVLFQKYRNSVMTVCTEFGHGTVLWWTRQGCCSRTITSWARRITRGAV